MASATSKTGETKPEMKPQPKREEFFAHQLSAGSKERPAIYVAEVSGWSNEDLHKAAQMLYAYQREKQWHDTDAKAAVYSFVKHDKKSTENVFVLEKDESADMFDESQFKTNAAIRAALGGKSKATFLVGSDGSLGPGVLINPLDLSRLKAFYL